MDQELEWSSSFCCFMLSLLFAEHEFGLGSRFDVLRIRRTASLVPFHWTFLPWDPHLSSVCEELPLLKVGREALASLCSLNVFFHGIDQQHCTSFLLVAPLIEQGNALGMEPHTRQCYNRLW